jgi:hypothetical protein
MSSSACPAPSCHSYVACMPAQGIGSLSFLMLLPENMSMLAIFGNELCVTSECDVHNAERMNAFK